MAKIESLKDIKVSANAEKSEIRKPSRDKFGRSYATGKRKDAVARVWIKPGKGNITVNSKNIDEYFARPVLKMVINQPFEVANRVNEFDVVCTVSGGGLSGQAGAIKHGISKALNEYEPELRAVLLVMIVLLNVKNTVLLKLVVLTNSANVNWYQENIKYFQWAVRNCSPFLVFI